MPPSATPRPDAPPDAALVLGLDLRHTHERAADAALLTLARRLPADAAADCWLATHWAGSGDDAHIALSVELAGRHLDQAEAVLTSTDGPAGRCAGDRAEGPADLVDGARAAQAAHAARRSGRLVRFPGSDALTGRLTVAELVERSAVDRVRVLAAGDAGPGEVVVTREHVRPAWSDGELVLLVQPAVGGTLVPFESPDPTPCCADHD
jgi:hypothetical protein